MNYNLILLKEGSNILVSNENIKYGDFFINNNGQISKCVKALEIWLIENLSTIKKVIAGIDTLPVLIYSDEVKQVLRDKYRWVEKIMDFSDWYDEQSWLPKVYDNSSKFDYELTIEDFKWNYMSSAFEAGFLQGKVHQSITNKMFSLENVKKAIEMAQKEGWDERGCFGLEYEPNEVLQFLQEPIQLKVEIKYGNNLVHVLKIIE